MKRIAIFFFAALMCAGIVLGSYKATTMTYGFATDPAGTPLSNYVPAGPLLYLEGKEFSSLLASWNSSSQKSQWSASSSHEVFSRSRLFLRLKEASDQFATAAGLPPDMSFLSQVAGGHSVLALYDIGNLQFLYITHLPSAKAMQSTLWQTRAKFEPRAAGGVNFYLRRDPKSQREVAFAISGDYLLLATREDLMAGALQLMSGSKDQAVAAEKWWAQSTAAAGPAGDLRMVLDLEKLVPNGYFRTYWLQKNITEMSQYSAAVSDLFLSGKQYREERVLLRKMEPEKSPSAGELAGAADLTRLVPDDASLYEATANPSADLCFALLESKLLAPHLGPAPPSQTAPQAPLTPGEAGVGSDLETRIDQASAEPPVTPQSVPALKILLDQSRILAALQVQSTERDPAGVFVRIHSAIVLVAASAWNEQGVQSALGDFVRPSLTASHLGVSWQQKSGYQRLDGLWPLVVAAHDKYLLVADDPALIEAMLANFSRAPHREPAEFFAGFNHAHERANFARFSGFLDRPNAGKTDGPGTEREPQFFSENIASLSSTLTGVSAENIVVRGDASKVMQTVTYEWSQ